MPDAWESFYLMVGSSSAVLIGLLFVVITLTTEGETSTTTDSQRTFLTPTVYHFGAPFFVSAVAITPELSVPVTAIAVALPALVGLFLSAGALMRLSRRRVRAPHWSDHIFYLVLPAALYLALLLSAWAFWSGWAWGAHAIAATVIALVLLGIRDAWDIATWLVHSRRAERSRG